MGSIISGIIGGITGGGAGGSGDVQSAEKNLMGTESNDTISQMNMQASLDQLKTQNQEAAQIADAANQIASTWEQVAQSKDQAQQGIVKSDTQSTAQS